MLFQRLNREDAEKAFLIVKNVNAGTMTAGYPCVWDITAPDGVRVDKPATLTLGLFVGIVDDDIAASAFGLVQVYGYRAAALVLGAAGTVGGDYLVPVAAQWYLAKGGTGTGAVGLVHLGETWETASAANKKVFIRAM